MQWYVFLTVVVESEDESDAVKTAVQPLLRESQIQMVRPDYVMQINPNQIKEP
jgi:hypothetical protein